MTMASDGNAFNKLLDGLREKFMLRELRDILKQHELGPAPGWEQLTARLNAADAALKAKAQTVLMHLYEGLVLAGTKNVHVFNFDKATTDDILTSLSTKSISPSRYAKSFPFPLLETDLHAAPRDHELVQKVEHANGDVSLILCARRTMEQQERFDASQVTQAVRTAFAGYDEFIAVKKTDYQVFDVLTVRRKLHRVEVLIDHPDRLRGETSEARCLTVLHRVMGLAPALKQTYEKNTPTNLYACINNLYDSSREGRVAKLSFRSPTHSVKREHMTSEKDLRTEAFHAAGVHAVGTITPYDVTIVWEELLKGQGPVSVRVGMSIAGLSAEGTYVRDAHIMGARSDAVVAALVNKLVSYSS
jgi:hypothetical protein